MAECVLCRRELEPDEIALTKKLVNRGAREFMCISCLARHFEVTEQVLRGKIAQYRESGCTLFK